MSILCPRCGREYDVTLFSFGRSIRCECNGLVSLFAGHEVREPGSGSPDSVDPAERQGMEEIARGADRIVDMILRRCAAPVDVDIAIERLRDRSESLFPGRGAFFEMVYAARFSRIREQWGGGECARELR